MRFMKVRCLREKALALVKSTINKYFKLQMKRVAVLHSQGLTLPNKNQTKILTSSNCKKKTTNSLKMRFRTSEIYSTCSTRIGLEPSKLRTSKQLWEVFKETLMK